jgi:biotin transport system substrate-specific component
MKLTTRDLVLVSMFTAITVVGTFINVKLPDLPLTLQTIFCTLAGALLGAKKGALSQLLYVLIGLVGFPVFTYGGGMSYVFRPSFGFLLGFIAAAYVTGKIIEKTKKFNTLTAIIACISGIAAVYAVGVPYFYAIFNFYMNDPRSIGWVMKVAVAPFIVKDLFVAVAVALLSVVLLPRLNKALNLGRVNC